MKPAITTLALLLLFTSVANAQRPGPDGRDRPELTPEQQQLVDQIHQVRADIHEALIAASQEYAALAAIENPTFEQRRQIAELRRALVPTEAADLADDLRELTAQLQALFPERPSRPERPTRQDLSEEQIAALEAHKDAVKALHGELIQLLIAADATGELGALVAIVDPTPEQRRRMLALRRELIANSTEAQAKLDEIEALRLAFQEANPEIRPRPRRIARHLRQEVHQDLSAVRDLHDQLNAELAERSEEYAELLAKEDKTPEDRARMMDIRQGLIDGDAELQGIADELADARQEVRQDVRRIRHVRDRFGSGRPSPLGRPGPGGDTDAGGTE